MPGSNYSYYNTSVSADGRTMRTNRDIPRSAFDVNYTHKSTFNSGNLIPLYIDQVLPGDSIRVNCNVFARIATMVTPVMDDAWLESFWFFCPSRILWSNFERFMGEQISPTDVTTFLIPQVTLAAAQLTFPGIADFFGITNNGTANSITVDALPFRMYNAIWNEWFRDQDIELLRPFPTGDGPDTATDYVLLTRAKRPDYFTTCRPSPQKWPGGSVYAPNFNAATYLPGIESTHSSLMGAQGAGAPVTGLGVSSGQTTVASGAVAETGSRTVVYPSHYGDETHEFRMRGAGGVGSTFPDVRVLVQDLRVAVMMQHMLEINSRGGTRYAELVLAHFGVRSPDARFQRPEYLGGGRTRINVNPVAQTSANSLTGSTTPLGWMSGAGTVVGGNHGFSMSFTEHGYVMGLFIVRANISYQQGTNRMWFKRTAWEYYWPALAHLGEQAVLSREIFCDGTGTAALGSGDFSVFGYQERWAEYKYKPNMITGAFRSTTATPLDTWHFAQLFSPRPTLNPAFIQDNTSGIGRVTQTTAWDGQQVLFDGFFEIRYVRPMPMFSIPGVGTRL